MCLDDRPAGANFMPMFDYHSFLGWLDSLDRTLVFAGVLAFVVLIVAVWSKYSRSKHDRHKEFR